MVTDVFVRFAYLLSGLTLLPYFTRSVFRFRSILKNSVRKLMWTERCLCCRLACSLLNISSRNINISAWNYFCAFQNPGYVLNHTALWVMIMTAVDWHFLFQNDKILTDMNVFEAIYKQLLDPLIVTVREETAIVTLLDCLHNCVRHDGSWRTPSDWNKIDDIIEKILDRVALENDRRLISIFLLYIAKLTTLPAEENSLFQNFVEFSTLESTVVPSSPLKGCEYHELRRYCKTNNNLLAYRWAKKLLNLFKSQALLGWSLETRLQLNVCHFLPSVRLPSRSWKWDKHWTSSQGVILDLVVFGFHDCKYE